MKTGDRIKTSEIYQNQPSLTGEIVSFCHAKGGNVCAVVYLDHECQGTFINGGFVGGLITHVVVSLDSLEKI